jgi:DNA-binding transcriptional LysR family regulator
MDLDLTDLSTFLEVAVQGSFGRAATALHLSQPSVSTRIAGLERTVGSSLFTRTTRGASLTSAGRAFEPYARRCLALAEEGRLVAQASAGVERLVMASPASLADALFPPVISALGSQPVEVVCRTAHSHEIVGDLLDGAVHVGFLQGASVPDGILVERLRKVPVVWVVAPTHPLADSHSHRLEELALHRVAVHSWGPAVDQLGEKLQAAGVRSPQICWVSPSSTALSLAMTYGHVAILPADIAQPALTNGSLVRLKFTGLPKWHQDVAVAYRSDAPSGPVATILQTLRQRDVSGQR